MHAGIGSHRDYISIILRALPRIMGRIDAIWAPWPVLSLLVNGTRGARQAFPRLACLWVARISAARPGCADSDRIARGPRIARLRRNHLDPRAGCTKVREQLLLERHLALKT